MIEAVYKVVGHRLVDAFSVGVSLGSSPVFQIVANASKTTPGHQVPRGVRLAFILPVI